MHQTLPDKEFQKAGLLYQHQFSWHHRCVPDPVCFIGAQSLYLYINSHLQHYVQAA